jgi:F-type H+-transporting ATPase subunit a
MINHHVSAIEVKVGEHHEWHIFGATVHADTIVATLIAGAIVVLLGVLLRRSMSVRKPGKLQLMWEGLVEQIEAQVESTMGLRTAPFAVPLAITLFVFILIANWLAIIPTPGDPEYMPPPASDVNLTYAMALFVIVLIHVTGVRKKGLWGFYKHMFRKPYALIPFNIIEEVVKPFTLALRLFGNIFAGVIMVSLIGLFPAFILWAPEVAWKLFDMFIGFIQAFIFALLTIIYFASVRADEEGAH